VPNQLQVEKQKILNTLAFSVSMQRFKHFHFFLFCFFQHFYMNVFSRPY